MQIELFKLMFAELKHEITIWQRAAASLSSYSKDEDTVRASLHKRVRRLVGELKVKTLSTRYVQHQIIKHMVANYD